MRISRFYRTALIGLAMTISSPPCRAQENAHPAFAVEFLGGVLGGGVGALVGGNIGASTGSCHASQGWFDTETQDCSSKVGGALLGAAIGQILGSGLGAAGGGGLMNQRGSIIGALGLSLLGEVVAVPLAFTLANSGAAPALTALLMVPALFGTFGYQIGAPAESETASRIRREGVKLAAIPAPAAGMKDGVRMNLVKVRF
jgi:hypothetical protein